MRHLNEFGHIFNSGTRSPLDTNTVYGRIVYEPEDMNQTETNRQYMIFREMGVQQDGPTISTSSTLSPYLDPGYGSNFGPELHGSENGEYAKKDPKHQPPGKFGHPVTSISPKQVCIP